MAMFKYIIKRFIAMLITLYIIATATFFHAGSRAW